MKVGGVYLVRSLGPFRYYGPTDDPEIGRFQTHRYDGRVHQFDAYLAGTSPATAEELARWRNLKCDHDCWCRPIIRGERDACSV